MPALTLPLTIARTRTFSPAWRLGVGPILYRDITHITQTAPPVLTVAGHNLPEAWPVRVLSVAGMRQINADPDTPLLRDTLHAIDVLDANTVTLPDLDATAWAAYRSGGVLQSLTPADLTGKTARLQVWDRPGGTLLLTRDTTDGGVTLDAELSTIGILLTPDEIDAIDWRRGVYSLDLLTGAEVDGVFEGEIEVTDPGDGEPDDWPGGLVWLGGEAVLMGSLALQGRPGASGATGAGASSFTATAAVALGGHRLVVLNADGEADYADSATVEHAWAVAGMTTGASSLGADATIQFGGEIDEPSWSWTPGLPIFLGANGVPTQTYPPSPALFALVVAVAATATRIVMGIKTPILYA